VRWADSLATFMCRLSWNLGASPPESPWAWPGIAFLVLCQCNTFSLSVITHYTLHTTHYTLHTTHYTLHSTHYTLHTTHYTLQMTHYTLHITHYTLHTTQYTLHTTHYTLHITHYTWHTTHYTLHTTHYTLHITHYTLHTTHYTLHITHYTLHITHYTLHTTHYTLHITHYTLHITSCLHLTSLTVCLCRSCLKITLFVSLKRIEFPTLFVVIWQNHNHQNPCVIFHIPGCSHTTEPTTPMYFHWLF